MMRRDSEAIRSMAGSVWQAGCGLHTLFKTISLAKKIREILQPKCYRNAPEDFG